MAIKFTDPFRGGKYRVTGPIVTETTTLRHALGGERPKFDRVAYQRELMRKRRAAEKEQKK